MFHVGNNNNCAFERVAPRCSSRSQPIVCSGHGMAVDASDIYVFGGCDSNCRDAASPCSRHRAGAAGGPSSSRATCEGVVVQLWKYNFATRRWIRLESRGISAACASSCLVVRNRQLFAYGGTGNPCEGGEVLSNVLKFCDCRDRNFLFWDMLETNPNIYDCMNSGNHMPPRAYGQSLVFHHHEIYIFGGGVGYYKEPISDLHRLDMRTRNWEKLHPLGSVPSGRFKQDIGQDNERFYVFGGGTLHYAAALAQLYAYDYKKNYWECIETDPDPFYGYPKPRCAFGLSQLEQDVYIVGGRYYAPSVPHEPLSDIWKISLQKFQWHKLNITLANPLCYHGIAFSPSGHMYVYGGMADDENVSSSCLHCSKKIFFVPRLMEISWEQIICTIDIDNISQDKLLELGIPRDFVNRVP